MSYRLISERKPLARKEHRCIWCGQSIPKGERYIAERSVFEGNMQNHKWHPECFTFACVVNDEPVWEFEPYENERGTAATPHTRTKQEG